MKVMGPPRDEPSAATLAASRQRPPLWVAVDVPALALQAWRLTLPEALQGAPLALLKGVRLGAVNDVAASQGLKPGMSRSTAMALLPSTVFGLASIPREAEALLSVAHVALAFTPSVTVVAQRTVLLEISTTLRAFGGLASLLKRLALALQPLGLRCRMATAPTAQGAAWLARWNPDPLEQLCERTLGLGELQRRLQDMPVRLLSAASQYLESWQLMGIHHLSDLRALPRDGLARRFGQPLLDEIDAAFGLRAQAHAWLQLPDRFEARLELMARADTTEQVLGGAQLLMARLVVWASARRGRIRRFELQMAHEPRHRNDDLTPAFTRLHIEQAEPGNDTAHLSLLLKERLARAPLPAPTMELCIRCHELAFSDAPNTELFPTRATEQEGLLRLVERLQARLGRERVLRIQPMPDHRPECGTQLLPLDAADAAKGAFGSAVATLEESLPRQGLAGAFTRPFWLYHPPRPLSSRQALPWLDGRPLVVLAGPERIETGWWDGEPVARDYFIAQAQDGSLVWVYRSRLPASEDEDHEDDDDGDEADGGTQASMPRKGPARVAVARGGGWFLQGRFG
ncbi:MAG: DNA polymerase Y family protein [Rubrivivax sp.]|jgi:protein ImuB|nr:DNA polymerase Y family protein [Rubrivivax sp.]